MCPEATANSLGNPYGDIHDIHSNTIYGKTNLAKTPTKLKYRKQEKTLSRTY